MEFYKFYRFHRIQSGKAQFAISTLWNFCCFDKTWTNCVFLFVVNCVQSVCEAEFKFSIGRFSFSCSVYF